jgi:L,D-peptidoglycan transpeptidase YkuD (ErfK/YbiS/YcfS/YnhG family)
MARPDPLYDIVLITDWNHPQARPGKGSAIFLHQRRRPGYPTAGCIALCRKDLLWLARHLRPGTGLVIPDLACFHLRANIPGSGAAPRPNRPPRDKA